MNATQTHTPTPKDTMNNTIITITNLPNGRTEASLYRVNNDTSVTNLANAVGSTEEEARRNLTPFIRMAS